MRDEKFVAKANRLSSTATSGGGEEIASFRGICSDTAQIPSHGAGSSCAEAVGFAKGSRADMARAERLRLEEVCESLNVRRVGRRVLRPLARTIDEENDVFRFSHGANSIVLSTAGCNHRYRFSDTRRCGACTGFGACGWVRARRQL